jgi:hypothetical protein
MGKDRFYPSMVQSLALSAFRLLRRFVLQTAGLHVLLAMLLYLLQASYGIRQGYYLYRVSYYH